jgi:hypothetical protein
MKTNAIAKSATPALLLIAWLLLPQTAHCYYNPSTGRWLSRDPIGDQAFFTAYSKGKPYEERQRIGREPLKPVYIFARNQPLSNLDPLGLRVVCVFNIRATHFQSGAVGAYQHFQSTDWGAVPTGDAYGYISCGANTLNDKVAGLNQCASIPGMPRNNNQDPLTDSEKRAMDKYGIPYDDLADDIPGFLDSALEAAKTLAKTRCGNRGCGCCMNIRIVITCDADATLADLPQTVDDLRRERVQGNPKCGKSTTLDCKSGSFTRLQ